jgi:dihydroorotase
MMSIEGNIVNKEGVKRQRVEIDEVSGLITKVGEPTGEADHVFKDELIFPGFIDLHVHAREDASHTQNYKEDFVTAGEAAINGGVVAFAEMPNNPIPPVDDNTYKVKNELTKKSAVPILLYAAISKGTQPFDSGQGKKVPYKVFMGQSIGHLFFSSRSTLEDALKNYQGQYISFHCEDPKILDENKDAPTHEQARPPQAEITAVDTALELIEKYDLTGKICHASTVEGIEKIVAAKKRGVKVTVEVTPHHLFFDETMFTKENHGLFQVNPPIRQTKENRLGMITALKRGDIDYLATDHAPHTIEEKQKGISGLTHLDTYGPFTTWLMKEHNFTTEEVARVCSIYPGRFMNNFIEGTYGGVKEGNIGSLTVIDMNKEITITSEFLKTKPKQSPFLGVTFPGSVVATVVKGKFYGK